MFLHRSLVSVVAMLAALCLLSNGASAQVFNVVLNGPSESPPNASPGTGVAQVTINMATHLFTIAVSYAGLTGPATNAHIHAATAVPFTGTAGVATQTPSFVGFPPSASGSYTNTFDMTLASTWNPAFITANGGTPAGAEAAFVAAIQAGKAYLNIHTGNFPAGEIRGFLVAVPDSGTSSALLLTALGGLAIMANRMRRLPQS